MYKLRSVVNAFSGFAACMLIGFLTPKAYGGEENKKADLPQGTLASEQMEWEAPYGGTVSNAEGVVTCLGGGGPENVPPTDASRASKLDGGIDGRIYGPNEGATVAFLKRDLGQKWKVSGEAFMRGRYPGFVIGERELYICMYGSYGKYTLCTHNRRYRSVLAREKAGFPRGAWVEFEVSVEDSSATIEIGEKTKFDVQIPDNITPKHFGLIAYHEDSSIKVRNLTVSKD